MNLPGYDRWLTTQPDPDDDRGALEDAIEEATTPEARAEAEQALADYDQRAEDAAVARWESRRDAREAADEDRARREEP